MDKSVLFTSFIRTRQEKFCKHWVVGGEILWIIFTALESYFSEMGGMFLGNEEEINVRGGNTIAVVKGWPVATNLDQIVFYTEAMEGLDPSVC